MNTVDDDSELALFGEDNFILPTWADQLTRDKALHMVQDSCPFCGCQVLQHRCKPVWSLYDIALIHGETDVLCAIILNKPLTRVVWNKSLKQASLRTVMTVKDADAYYLQCHECGKQPVNSVHDNYSFPARHHHTTFEWYEGTEPTETEIQDFTEAWS